MFALQGEFSLRFAQLIFLEENVNRHYDQK